MEGNLCPRDAAAGIELAELCWIAEDERRCQHVCCLTPALADGDVHQNLVTAGVVDRRPGGDGKASPWRERPPHLAQGGHAVRKIHERELADHDVETRVLEGKRGRIAQSPFDVRLGSRCDRQHPLIEIQADNLTFLADPPQGLAGEHAVPQPTSRALSPLLIPAASATGPAQAPKIAGTKQDS